jgi:predicted nucleic acid-binding protein
MKAAVDPVPSFMPDTSCLVALLLPRHEHHERVFQEMERRLDAGETMVVAAHTLVETYAVLTRLPAPHRLPASDCRALIEANFAADAVPLIALAANDYRRLIHDAPDRGIAGGRVYDAVIAACARSAQAATLLTLNDRHFVTLGGDLTTVSPVNIGVELL